MNKLPTDFNWIEYLDVNPDLRKAKIITKNQAIQHWINHGYNEKRVYKKDIININTIIYYKDIDYKIIEIDDIDKYLETNIYIFVKINNNYNEYYEKYKQNKYILFLVNSNDIINNLSQESQYKFYYYENNVENLTNEYFNKILIKLSIITPYCIGIGDIFLYYSYFINNHYNIMVLNSNLILSHRNNSLDYKLFIEKLLNDLNIKFIWQKLNRHDTSLYFYDKITDLSIVPNANKNLSNIFNINIELPEKYIVIHTKFRLDINSIYNLKNIEKFMTDYKCNYPIILIGERNTTDNLENKLLNVQNIYNILLKLFTNNIVYDYTTSINLQDNPNYDLFKKDLTIIKNAEINIIFGIGGNFVISSILGKKTIAYIDNLDNEFKSVFYHLINTINCKTWDNMEIELNKI